MAKVVIIVSGGMVQNIIIDDPTVKTYVVDYDMVGDPPTITIEDKGVYAFSYPQTLNQELTEKIANDIKN